MTKKPAGRITAPVKELAEVLAPALEGLPGRPARCLLLEACEGHARRLGASEQIGGWVFEDAAEWLAANPAAIRAPEQAAEWIDALTNSLIKTPVSENLNAYSSRLSDEFATRGLPSGLSVPHLRHAFLELCADYGRKVGKVRQISEEAQRRLGERIFEEALDLVTDSPHRAETADALALWIDKRANHWAHQVRELEHRVIEEHRDRDSSNPSVVELAPAPMADEIQTWLDSKKQATLLVEICIGAALRLGKGRNKAGRAAAKAWLKFFAGEGEQPPMSTAMGKALVAEWRARKNASHAGSLEREFLETLGSRLVCQGAGDRRLVKLVRGLRDYLSGRTGANLVARTALTLDRSGNGELRLGEE